MQAITKAIVMGLIQALTEFLPVSSSGHMVIAKTYLGIEEVGITLEVVTHVATALAVIIYLRKRIMGILRAVYSAASRGTKGLPEDRYRDFRVFLYIILGSIPAAVVGLLVREQVGRLFEDAKTTAVMLILTGVFVFLSGRSKPSGVSLGAGRAALVGLAQALAIIPGLSRSGLTVGSGLMSGLRREEAFEFSLLLSLPAILGGAAVEALSGRIGGDARVILAAAIPALVGGYFAIWLLFRAVVRNRFHTFAYYLVPVGIAVLLLP
jgi:undecaprenyl-diphosphatase